MISIPSPSADILYTPELFNKNAIYSFTLYNRALNTRLYNNINIAEVTKTLNTRCRTSALHICLQCMAAAV